MENSPVHVRFLATHPAFGYFPGQVAEVSAEQAKELIAGGFAEKAEAVADADERAVVPAAEVPAPAVDEAPEAYHNDENR